MKNDEFGDRMKGYERPSTGRYALKGIPLIARLDGKSFHTFTKGLERPFDPALSRCMAWTMAALVEEYQANVGYTQSDEITLAWYQTTSSAASYPYEGRFQKIESLMAAYATAKFNSLLYTELPSKVGKLPIFDCRAFNVPTLVEGVNSFLWRQQDATKNAISMAAQSMFSHKSLQGMSGSQMQERMWAEKGINFNDYPPHFKRGIFAVRRKVEREMTAEDRLRIPEAHWPADGLIVRNETKFVDYWLSRIVNKQEVLFGGEDALMNTYIAEDYKDAVSPLVL